MSTWIAFIDEKQRLLVSSVLILYFPRLHTYKVWNVIFKVSQGKLARGCALFSTLHTSCLIEDKYLQLIVEVRENALGKFQEN